MTGITCTIPVLWSIGEASAALCARAGRLGPQRARFNWVELVARPGDSPADLARAYWRAVAIRAQDTDAVGPVLTADSYSMVEARNADDAARAERARLAEARA